MKFIVHVLAIVPFLAFSGFNGKGATRGMSPDSIVEILLQDYLLMKDALVADNTWGAALAASRMKLILNQYIHSVPSRGLSNPSNPLSMALPSLDQISGSGNIEVQRRYFAAVSDLARSNLGKVGLLPVRVFIQHCPMALNNRGAFWLSTHETVQNPYFGAEMLHCGKVTGQIEGKSVAPAIDPELLVGKLESRHVHGCHGPGQ